MIGKQDMLREHRFENMFMYRGKYNQGDGYREETFQSTTDAIDFALENIRECYEFKVINTDDYSTVYSTRVAESEYKLNILSVRSEGDGLNPND